MASITITDLVWSAPDQGELFSSLNLSFTNERTGLIGRNGVGKTTLLRLMARDILPQGGAIHVDGRIGMLRQSVQIGAGETVADMFGVSEDLERLNRIENGSANDEDWEKADWSLEPKIKAALDKMDLPVTTTTKIVSLSGGQRTRVGIAALVFADPDFILLDEPTNNLDREGRRSVVDLLVHWKRGAIVISHDRELLEHMDAIVEMTSLGATRYGGNWSVYRALKEQERAAVEHSLKVAEKNITQITRGAQSMVERQARKDAGGKQKKSKNDAPRILMGRRQEQAERTGGTTARIFQQRRQEAQQAADHAREAVEKSESITATIASTGLPMGRRVLTLDRVVAGYDLNHPIIKGLSLTVTGPERIGITGSNGSGKSTLLSIITGSLKPWSGIVSVDVHHAFLDQTVSTLDPGLTVRDNFYRVHPGIDENTCRSSLARFLFRGNAALQLVSNLSGGQLLRAGLACTLGGPQPPQLLILDEPTNHLDIASIEAVEMGLNNYDGALLVVSHDETFLKSINVERRICLD